MAADAARLGRRGAGGGGHPADRLGLAGPGRRLRRQPADRGHRRRAVPRGAAPQPRRRPRAGRSRGRSRIGSGGRRVSATCMTCTSGRFRPRARRWRCMWSPGRRTRMRVLRDLSEGLGARDFRHRPQHHPGRTRAVRRKLLSRWCVAQNISAECDSKSAEMNPLQN